MQDGYKIINSKLLRVRETIAELAVFLEHFEEQGKLSINYLSLQCFNYE
jgi:hypothetical protein